MKVELHNHSRKKLLKHFNALEDASFVDHCLELIHRGVDLAPFFNNAEFLYEDVIDAGTAEHVQEQSGFIYLAANPVYQANIYKLGKTRKSALARMRSLATAGVLGEYVLVGSWPTRDIDRTEARCHQLLSEIRIDGEFFHSDYQSLVSAILRVLREEDEAFSTLSELTIGR